MPLPDQIAQSPEPSPDRIVLRGIQAIGRHGVLDFEHEHSQPFEVDVEIELDLSAAASSDDLADTVDYGEIVGSVKSLVEERSFRLLEALAGAIADELLGVPVASADSVTPADSVTSVASVASAASAVTVEVRKLRPPVAAQVASVGVRIRRARS